MECRAVVQMSERGLTRLRVMIDLVDKRITTGAAAVLTSLGRRQVLRLRRAFECDGPSALASRKRGRRVPSMFGSLGVKVT